jgi:hypothetical protein
MTEMKRKGAPRAIFSEELARPRVPIHQTLKLGLLCWSLRSVWEEEHQEWVARKMVEVQEEAIAVEKAQQVRLE